MNSIEKSVDTRQEILVKKLDETNAGITTIVKKLNEAIVTAPNNFDEQTVNSVQVLKMLVPYLQLPLLHLHPPLHLSLRILTNLFCQMMICN